jgi:DNA-binding transcriptional regulator YiaG
MADIGTLLKQEIVRLARRELRSQIGPARKILANHRREIAALKRELVIAQKKIGLLESRARNEAATAQDQPSEHPIRFVAKGLRSLRARLGLSGADLAKLLGVSEQSVYNWEQKKTVPRKEQVVALVGLRKLGKREARARLGKG